MTMIDQNTIALVAFVIGAANVSYQGGKVVLDYTSLPPVEGHATAPDIVEPGGEYAFRWTITKRTNCPGVNARVWTGENGFHLAEVYRPTSIPASDVPVSYVVPTMIPQGVPAGRLEMSIRGEYQCPGRPVQTFTLGPVPMTVASTMAEEVE